MELLLLGLCLPLYVLATAGLIVYLMVAHETARRFALFALGGGFVLHLGALIARILGTGSLAMNAFHDQLSLFAWLTVGMYLALQFRYHLTVVGALVSPLAFLLSFSAYIVHAGADALPHNLRSAWLPAHVAAAFLGYAIFAIAFCISVIYLHHESQLKAKRRTGAVWRLPSLETLDDLNYRIVAWGFALFTLGIVTGSLLSKATWGTFWSWEPKQVLSVLAWLLYAVLLQTRSIGWRGRRAAHLTIVGFAVLIISFLGFNLLFPTRHGGSFG
jgi:cytochrome c-type biogenesis protein CcsB